MEEAAIQAKITKEMLPCVLTNDELLDFGSKLAQASQSVESAQVTRREAMKQGTEEIRKAREERDRLAEIVFSKKQYREIEVEVAHDYDKGRIRKVRRDNGETILDREMNEDERQTSLSL